MDEPTRIEDMRSELMHRCELLVLNSKYGRVAMRSPYQQQLKLGERTIKDVTPKGE